MLEGKAVIGETDMLQTMQQNALSLAGKALDTFDVTDSTEIARFIKKVMLDPVLPIQSSQSICFMQSLYCF